MMKSVFLGLMLLLGLTNAIGQQSELTMTGVSPYAVVVTWGAILPKVSAPGVTTIAWTITNPVSLPITVPNSGVTYNLYRSTVSGQEGLKPFQVGLLNTSYVDALVELNSTYYYQVTAVCAICTPIESLKSNETHTTIPIVILALPPGIPSISFIK